MLRIVELINSLLSLLVVFEMDKTKALALALLINGQQSQVTLPYEEKVFQIRPGLFLELLLSVKDPNS